LLPACAGFASRVLDAQGAQSSWNNNPTNLAVVVALLAVVCAATVALLTRPMGRDGIGLRAPLGGILPVSIGVGVAALFSGLAGELPLGERVTIQVAVAIPIGLAAALFELRIRRGLGGARVAGGDRSTAVIAVSLGFIAVILAVEGVARHLYLATFAVLAALTCAALLDLFGELRARWRRPTLTAAWNLHQPQLAGLVERALESRGLGCHMRARHLRTCLGIFGAFVPITALVDRERVGDAREIIESVLGGSAAARGQSNQSLPG
jgi:hypothetical protein